MSTALSQGTNAMNTARQRILTAGDAYQRSTTAQREREELIAGRQQLADAAALAAKNGIEVYAGHGLTFDNLAPIAAIRQVAELNIGHFLVGEAIFTGLDTSVRRMRDLMDEAR